jgi:two-component system, sporulation sensor kinase E
MASPSKSNFLDKVLGRIGRLDTRGLQTVVERLARERQFLEMVFNTIEDGILVVDERGSILYYNSAVSRLLGVPASGAEGEPAQKYVAKLDWEKLLEMDRSGGQRVARHELEVSYPQARYLRLYVAPLDGEARSSSGLAVVVHDATEARKETFEAIETERIHSLTLLAASVAHEIGNPLNALHIHLQLMGRELKKLRETAATMPSAPVKTKRATVQPSAWASEAGEIADKLENYLDVAKGEITRLDYIVTQFLQAIRPTQPQFKPYALNGIVEETLELLRPELENRGIKVEVNLSSRLPMSPIDSGQIKQALVNLVKNAMQAMAQGGKLILETGEAADGVWVSVADTGGGIPAEQLNRIFEPFYTTKKKGTGLGLMIVQRIVREHGGHIDLESHVGKGTKFRIWLPLRESQPRLLESHLHD